MNNIAFYFNGALLAKTISTTIPRIGDKINLSTNLNQTDQGNFVAYRCQVADVEHVYQHDVSKDIDPSYTQQVSVIVSVTPIATT